MKEVQLKGPYGGGGGGIIPQVVTMRFSKNGHKQLVCIQQGIYKSINSPLHCCYMYFLVCVCLQIYIIHSVQSEFLPCYSPGHLFKAMI